MINHEEESADGLVERKIGRIERFTSSLSHIVPKLRRITRDFFDRSFQDEEKDFIDDFDPQEYIDLYYPPIDPTIFIKVSEVLSSCETSEEGSPLRILDIQKIEKKFKTEDSSFNTEALENYCIYDFIIRHVLPCLLEKRPDDHFTILDIGGGPTIYQHIPLALVADSITHGEFLSANRETIELWRQGNGHDWSDYISFCQNYIKQPFSRQKIRPIPFWPNSTGRNRKIH